MNDAPQPNRSQQAMPPEHAVNVCALMASMFPKQYVRVVQEYRISLLEAKLAAFEARAAAQAPANDPPPSDSVPLNNVEPLKGAQ